MLECPTLRLWKQYCDVGWRPRGSSLRSARLPEGASKSSCAKPGWKAPNHDRNKAQQPVPCPPAGKQIPRSLKHLAALRAAKPVVTEENPHDGRRLIYRLSPDIVVRWTETALEVDFGCGVVWV